MSTDSEGRCLPPGVNESHCTLFLLRTWGRTLRHHGIHGMPTRKFLEQEIMGHLLGHFLNVKAQSFLVLYTYEHLAFK